MYPRLWVPQLHGHIFNNFAWNTVLLLVLPAIYLLLPQIVAVGHGYLRGSGYVPSELEQHLSFAGGAESRRRPVCLCACEQRRTDGRQTLLMDCRCLPTAHL